MGVGWTGVRYDVEPSRADEARLLTEHRRWVGPSQGEFEKRPICGEPVKARDARRVALTFLKQAWHPLLKVASVEIPGVGGWTLDDVRKTDPEVQKLSIVLGSECVGTERSPHALAQLRRGERGPEPAPQTREVVSSLNRVQPGIDSDEDEVEPWLEIVWQRPKRVSVVHPGYAFPSGLCGRAVGGVGA